MMEKHDQKRGRAERTTHYLTILTVLSGLSVAFLFSVIALDKISGSAHHRLAPRIFTNADIEAEKNNQRRIITMLQFIPDAIAGQEFATQSESRQSFAQRSIQPGKDRPETPRQVKSPSPILPLPKPWNDDRLMRYFVDQMARLNIGVQGLSSRLAVAENNIGQLQDLKNWRNWIPLAAAVVAVIQGIATIAFGIIDRRRKKNAGRS